MMNSYFVNISDEYLKNKDLQRKNRKYDGGQFKREKNILNSYQERYRYNKELRQGLQRPAQKKKRKHKVSQHRKETYLNQRSPSGSEDDEVGHVIPTIEHIRLAGTTRRKLLERRISLLKEKEHHVNVESRFSDRELQALSVYHPSTSHSSHHSRAVHTAILENDIADDSEYGAIMRDTQAVRKVGRSHRASVLKKAERLLLERKRQEFGSSSEADAEDSPRVPTQAQQRQRLTRPFTYVARRSRSRSPSSEREYINVPEIIDPTEDNNDMILGDIDIEENEYKSASENLLPLPSNKIRLHSNEGSIRNYRNSRSPVGYPSSQIKSHDNEDSVRDFRDQNRLPVPGHVNRSSSAESKVRRYLRSAAQLKT